MSSNNDASPGAITQVQEYPTSDDTVAVTDPSDPPETEPRPGDAAKLDADGGAITHIPQHSRGRMLSATELLDFGRGTWKDRHPHGRAPEKGSADPDAAFGTGTDAHPIRYTRDQALQVVPVPPTSFTPDRITVSTAQAVALVGDRAERKTVLIKNMDATNTVYIGPSAAFGTATGYPLGPGEALMLDTIGSVFGAVVPGSPVTVAILDQLRSDVDAD